MSPAAELFPSGMSPCAVLSAAVPQAPSAAGCCSIVPVPGTGEETVPSAYIYSPVRIRYNPAEIRQMPSIHITAALYPRIFVPVLSPKRPPRSLSALSVFNPSAVPPQLFRIHYPLFLPAALPAPYYLPPPLQEGQPPESPASCPRGSSAARPFPVQLQQIP